MPEITSPDAAATSDVHVKTSLVGIMFIEAYGAFRRVLNTHPALKDFKFVFGPSLKSKQQVITFSTASKVRFARRDSYVSIRVLDPAWGEHTLMQMYVGTHTAHSVEDFRTQLQTALTNVFEMNLAAANEGVTTSHGQDHDNFDDEDDSDDDTDDGISSDDI